MKGDRFNKNILITDRYNNYKCLQLPLRIQATKNIILLR